jgi:hypothetical protein
MSKIAELRLSYCALVQLFQARLKGPFNHLKSGLLLLSTLSLVACGSGIPQIATGVFIDSTVEGLNYQTKTHSGITNSRGEYRYEPGETVTFSVGGIVLGSAPATGVVTPLSLVPAAIDETDQKVTNIVRLLLTIDSDGNPDNGITISREVAAAAANLVVDFSVVDLSTDAGIISLLGMVPSRTLADESTAQSHFGETLAALERSTWGTLVWGGSVWRNAPEEITRK